MRTDVKIGLVVGLLIVIAGVVFVASNDGKPQGDPDEVAKDTPPAETDSNKPEYGPAPGPAAVQPGEIVIPSFGSERSITRTGPDTRPAVVSTDRTVRPIVPVVPTLRIDEPPRVTRIHTVRQGDTLWGIAKAEYGDVRLVSLLLKANPDVKAKNLKIGQKLKVPPKPVSIRPTAAGGSIVAGRTLKSDEMIYKVQAGDKKGFWGIAQKKYGHGKHMTLIAGRNPKVNPRKLRIGQILVLPPLPQAGGRSVAPNVVISGTSPARTTTMAAFESNDRPIFD